MAKKQKENQNNYSNSHTITEFKDVQKRLENMEKTKEFNKNLKIEKDRNKKMNKSETPFGTLYTDSGFVPDSKAKAIFVDKKGKVLYNKGGR